MDKIIISPLKILDVPLGFIIFSEQMELSESHTVAVDHSSAAESLSQGAHAMI